MVFNFYQTILDSGRNDEAYEFTQMMLIYFLICMVTTFGSEDFIQSCYMCTHFLVGYFYVYGPRNISY